MARWIEPEESRQDFPLDPGLGLNDLQARLLAARGLTDPDKVRAFLDPGYYQPTPAEEIPGLDAGVSAVEMVIRQGRKIGVWGDFDVDGQTSTALLVSGLKNLGADVVYHIPVRATESHGIKIPYLDEFMHEGFDLLLTCDTGISEHEAIAYAKKRGLRVVITDHHDLPETLPEAEAVINPKLLPDDHPLAKLPGVGVAFKFIEALYQRFGRENDTDNFLDLAALGIVADLAELTGDTRYLLQLGLLQLKQTIRLGLQAIYERNELDPGRITEEEIGYVIAPRLNALGRLGDANPIVEFLTTENQAEADVTAEMLEGLNAKRRTMSDHVYKGALAELERHPEFGEEAAIVLSNEHWPPGVVGIVASRLVDQFQKPVVLLKESEDGMAGGSARSVPGCDISAALRSCEDLIENFGGHPMAAGLRLKVENIDRFRKKLSMAVAEQIGEVRLEPELVIDQFIGLDEIDLSLVRDTARLAPFGNGNPPVRFAAKELSLVGQSFLGRNQTHRKLVVEDAQGSRQTVFWWQSGGSDLPRNRFDLAFSLRESVFRGEHQVQVYLEDFREIEDHGGDKKKSGSIEIVDLRGIRSPVQKLIELLDSESNVQVWGEGEIQSEIKSHVRGRTRLGPSDTLVIWTAPPNAEVLVSALRAVKPLRLVIFGRLPEDGSYDSFLERLAGLAKYAASRKAGEASLEELASATAQTELVVGMGVSWLEAKGNISIQEKENGIVQIQVDPSKNLGYLSIESIEQDLKALLDETQLFREYFTTCGVGIISELIS